MYERLRLSEINTLSEIFQIIKSLSLLIDQVDINYHS